MLKKVLKSLVFLASFTLLFFLFVSTSSAQTHPNCPSGEDIYTAIGCIPVGNNLAFAEFFINWGIKIGGGLAFLMMVYSGFLIMTSGGDPKRLAAGKELLTAAIAGLVLIVLGTYFLRLVAVNILGIF